MSEDQGPVGTTSTTSRSVPVPCEVCKQRGYRPEDPEDVDSEWKQCDACHGKGWSNVTETIVTKTP